MSEMDAVAELVRWKKWHDESAEKWRIALSEAVSRAERAEAERDEYRQDAHKLTIERAKLMQERDAMRNEFGRQQGGWMEERDALRALLERELTRTMQRAERAEDERYAWKMAHAKLMAERDALRALLAEADAALADVREWQSIEALRDRINTALAAKEG
jgi:hypothetical protein